METKRNTENELYFVRSFPSSYQRKHGLRFISVLPLRAYTLDEVKSNEKLHEHSRFSFLSIGLWLCQVENMHCTNKMFVLIRSSTCEIMQKSMSLNHTCGFFLFSWSMQLADNTSHVVKTVRKCTLDISHCLRIETLVIFMVWGCFYTYCHNKFLFLFLFLIGNLPQNHSYFPFFVFTKLFARVVYHIECMCSVQNL